VGSRLAEEVAELLDRYGEDAVEWLSKIRDTWIQYRGSYRCFTCNSSSIRWLSDFEYECESGHRGRILGLESWEFGVPPWFMRLLADRGIARVLYRSRSTTTYGIPEQSIRVIEDALRSSPVVTAEELAELPREEPTAEMFSDIVGLDDVKKLVLDVLRADKPVHLLIVGPPASAKTMILEAISRFYNVPIVLAGTSTRAGLRDFIVENAPELMLIDELDKVDNPLDLSVLLTWMESQRLAVTMATKRAVVRCPTVCKVIAAANRVQRIPPELLSRFVVVYVKQYTEEESRAICLNVLVRREGVSQELATRIADAVVGKLGSRDPRDCVKVARLAKSPDDVDRIVETLKGRRAR